MSLFGLENIWQAVPDEYTEFKSETNQSQYIVWYSSLTWSDSHDNILLVCNDKGFFKIYEFPKNLATHYTESYPIVSPLEFNTNEEITAVEYYPRSSLQIIRTVIIKN
ncbi:hypothetical protein A3Q56_01899 [Intoshia linei]|uniref:Uncharacterized protein n=1 Tax=Intoshia linei TaxID=1819745 RepID=A0A177B9I8_9BILA|nr:hypothetical protein A3Q56_01899 [Intoshia linei]